MRYLLALTLTLLLLSCSDNRAVLSDSREATEIPDIWYQGKAEVSTYELIQNRYNDTHPGKMTTVFVTEDFLTDKQVKNDSGKSANSTGVLKMNKVRRFTTGIYDYSLFTSVFTDVKKARTYKATTSSQDWCGHSYMQLNRAKDKYKVKLQSYFEDESVEKTTKAVVTEDDIPLLIKIDPSRLPSGDFEVLPSLEYTLLRHIDYKPIAATASMDTVIIEEHDGYDYVEPVHRYTVEMPSLRRKLTYYYSDEPQRQITMWEDEHPSAFDGKLRTTRATLLHSEWLPYWSLNNKKDSQLREQFGLNSF